MLEGYFLEKRPVVRGITQVSFQKLSRMVLWAMSVSLASSVVALAQNDPAADIAMAGNGEASLPFSAATTDPSQGAGCCDAGFGQSCCSRWTASADLIILQRVGSFNQTLVETEPGTVPVKQLYNTPGTGVLNATDLHQGFSGGPRFDLIHTATMTVTWKSCILRSTAGLLREASGPIRATGWS